MRSIQFLEHQRAHGLCEAVTRGRRPFGNYYCKRRATMVVTFGGAGGGEVRACRQHAKIWQTWNKYEGAREWKERK